MKKCFYVIQSEFQRKAVNHLVPGIAICSAVSEKPAMAALRIFMPFIAACMSVELDGTQIVFGVGGDRCHENFPFGLALHICPSPVPLHFSSLKTY